MFGGHWVVVYERDLNQSKPMTKGQAKDLLRVFDDAIYITKVSGMFRGKIIRKKRGKRWQRKV